VSTYFTDREYGTRPQTIDVIDERLWAGLYSLIQTGIGNGSFGLRFPEQCPDGNGPCGCDVQAFRQVLGAEVPWIEWSLSPNVVPDTPVILDLLEFCASAVGEPIQGAYHSYYRHHHLSWDRDAGLARFVADVDLLFRRNAVAYELTATGEARRLLPQAIANTIGWASFHTGDAETDKLLEAARQRIGAFDLIIVDEAHKNRSEDGGLSTVLENVILKGGECRRLALTATPIELDVSQWESTLKRLDTTEAQRAPIVAATERYAQAIRRLRLGWRTNREVLDEYRAAAAQFSELLSPYLLRRDKREDEDVLKFKEASGQSEYDYRHLREVPVYFKDLSQPWRHVVCAAEALSVVREPATDGRTKRLRLTIGNGHGLAAVIDEALYDKEENKKQVEEDRAQAEDGTSGPDRDADPPVATRSAWWASTLRDALANDPDILFDHPAILAAVRTIEEEAERGEKVLVFGRFTRPMRALVSLLNARQMFKVIEQGRPWPQSKVHEDRRGPEFGEWPAVRTAHRQLSSKADLTMLDDLLAQYYRRESDQRARQREGLLSRLRAGLAGVDASGKGLAILDAIERLTAPATGDVEEDEHHVALLARAIAANTDRPDASDADLAKAFRALVEAAGDHDSSEEEEFDEELAEEAWTTLEEHLREGYTSQQGGFARLMYGETKPQTRRMIQFAFNRPNSFPRVLVAQSLVGREGLNLHESCRIVVLLHPESNPGVVEQQIGRVDRVNSQWAKALRQAIDDGKKGPDLPRIEIRPIIFKETYDEHNWNVLRERWDDLRAQLHGEAVPARLRTCEDAEGRAILDEIIAARPSFSPRKN